METTPSIPAVPFELQSLAEAHRYQAWLKAVAWPHLGNRILELGSGIGNLSQHLPRRERLILSDIDPALLSLLRARFPDGGGLSVLTVKPGEPLAPRLAHENLDTVVSFNVLEHVPDDSALLADMISLLKNSRAPGPKRIVSLVPAHQWAFGSMDEVFGHCRRYTDRTYREALRKAGAGELGGGNYYSRYMNLPALLGWWVTGRLLAKREIGSGSMKAFEALCPFIRPVDDFLHEVLRLPLGNSLFAVYEVKNG